MATKSESKMSQETSLALEGYADFLTDIKSRIQTAQMQAALSLSREVVRLYWQIGHEVLERQARYGWGAKVVERLATDLKAAFPGVEGFSPRNIKYMRAFAQAYSDYEIAQQLLHNSPLRGAKIGRSAFPGVPESHEVGVSGRRPVSRALQGMVR